MRVPRGLVLFAPGTPPGYRRRRIAFLVILAAATASLLWPVQALFAGPRPFVLGLPLPLAWILLWLAVLFLAMLWLYRAERP
jgi:hypothetical protein